MIELTVKTLDSQNHSFTVEDDITVEQFKAKIADTVNIPAETQRIIYCGRVLQDSAKLNDYDVNGKVVHLVQRPPPSANQRIGRTSTPEPVPGRRNRTLDGNAMYLGSMAFPSNLMESQGIVPPPPTHSLAGSRLNVARRMLRKAEAVVRLLENPSARPNEQPQPEDNQEEEVTPVIEARVLVPTNENEPIDEAMVLSAVQNSLFNVGAVNMNRRGTNETSNAERARRSSEPSTTSTPDGQTPRSSSTENLTETQSENTANVLAENASRTTEMAELLTMLNQLQVRFAPFLERYQTFMQEDPVVAPENVRSTQAMITRVSEVLHFLGHAYHSLSDIIVRVRTPPQRPLLCRPILIQHSAVVQAGIPIQVEAQINLSADRPPGFGSPSNGSAPNPPTSTENSQTPSTTANQQSRTATAPNMGTFSFLPTAMRVQSFPVEIRTISRPTNPTPRPQNNNNNTVDATDNANIQSTTTDSTTTTSNATTTTTASGTSETNGSSSFNLNNPNLEFFMEVTPEGITIDSLETTLVGSPNQANDLLRGALNGPSPEFRQALNRMIQVAGELFSRTGAPTAATTTAAATDSAQSTTAVNLTGQSTSIGQNSQARGNTQTNPTTATHTRSTPRPHVHLAQQAMQGGFDPFLPCNSHHITPRRRVQAQTHQTATQMGGARSESGARTAPQHNQNIYNIINGLVNSLNSVNAGRNVNPTQNTTNNENGNVNGDVNVNAPPLQSLLTILPGMSLPDLMRFHLNQDGNYEPGESLFADLIVILIRNITMVDLLTFSNDLVEPIMRNHIEIQRFVATRILNNATGPDAVDRGVDLIIQEMRPFLQNFIPMPVRDDIDIVRSAETLFRTRLPNIINLASTLTTSTAAANIRLLIDQVVTTLKHMCALILRASLNGQPGVEQIFEEIVNPFIQDLAPDIRNWTLVASRVHLRQFISNLNVPESVLQPYITRRSSIVNVPTPQLNVRPIEEMTETNKTKCSNKDEAMELDEQEASSSNTTMCSTIILDDPEPLPNIVLGSESWHSQVPEEWVPIIARDSQKQRRQNPQGPFSDAYLSGMPSKRRKIVTSSKPEGSLSQVISESVRQAVTATGLSSVAPLETVVQAAAASPEIQTAYTNLLRSSVQSSLRDNEDFTPERFPNVSTYFNNSQQ